MLRPTLLVLAGLALPVLAPSGPRTAVHAETRADLGDVNLAAAVANAQAQSGGEDGLGQAWCGDALTSDDTAHAAYPVDRAQVKVVYAHAADRPNQFAGWADAIQTDVAIVQRFLSAQGGGTKAIRFDMGTRCGPEYVDIQSVTLPGPHASYAGDFRAISSAVEAAIDGAGPRNTLILADELSTTGYEFGLGETVMGADGEQPGPDNPHNRGGLSAVLFSRNGAAPPGPGATWWPEGLLHEVTHTLGAVQWGAPHSTQPPGQQNARYGHCWQGTDVMCYAEDSGAAQQLRVDCGTIEGAIIESYDCGRDDYFNPAPPPDSYLATHWNVYDSAFLAPCAEVVPACGSGGTATATPRPPAATSGPAIEGKSRRGVTLRAKPGNWINAPHRYAYQWQRQSGHTWRNVFRATKARYVAATRDLGRRLRVIVTATNADGVTAATSDPTAPVGAVAIQRTAGARSSAGAHREDRRKTGRR